MGVQEMALRYYLKNIPQSKSSNSLDESKYLSQIVDLGDGAL